MNREVASHWKYADLKSGIVPITYDGVGFRSWPIPAGGSAFYQRVGNKIEYKRTSYKLRIIPTWTGSNHTVPPMLIRMVLVWDKSYNRGGTQPNFSDVCQDTDVLGNAISVADSGYNQNNRDRFIVLKDYSIPCPGYSTNLSGSIFWMQQADQCQYLTFIEEDIEIRGLIMKFATNLTNGNAVTSGRIYLVTASLWAGQSANDAQAAWSLQYTARIYYDDD